jgi:hypothetical protein
MRSRRASGNGRSDTAPRLVLCAACLVLVALLLFGCSGATSLNKPMTVQSYAADWDPAFLTLESMTRQADVIVLGSIADDPTARWNTSDSKQPKGGGGFYTTWTVRVEKAVSGGAKPGGLVAFRWEGGTVDADGGLTRLQGNDYPQLSKGMEVIVFGTTDTVMPNTSGLPGYWLLAGGYSVFRLQDGSFVRAITAGGEGVANTATLEEIEGLLPQHG